MEYIPDVTYLKIKKIVMKKSTQGNGQNAGSKSSDKSKGQSKTGSGKMNEKESQFGQRDALFR